MPETDWQKVVANLRALSSGHTVEQDVLAERIGVVLEPDVPRPVAVVLLRQPLRSALELPPPPAVSDGQLEYLRDLAEQTQSSVPLIIDDRDTLDAWIAVFHARRAADALEELRPEPGDVVSIDKSGGEAVGEVLSISADGRLNFRGGWGSGARPHQVSIAARHGRTDENDAALYNARQQAAARRPTPQVSKASRSELEPWRVAANPGLAARAALQDALSEASDEKPMQAVLEQHPQVLAYLVDGHDGLWVVPQKKLGAQYVPDFLVAGETSAGIRWTLVEIESPTAPLTISDGQPEKRLRKAIKQIADWREWLGDNLDYARKSRAENGMGLAGIRADAPALIIIGRGEQTASIDRMRNRVRSEQGIEIRTYDWLIRACNTQRGLPLGIFDYELEVLNSDHEPSY